MKLTKSPCKIIGLSVGEVSANLLNPDSGKLEVKFVLLRDPEIADGLNAGQYTKNREWSEKTKEAFWYFMECAEEDALKEVFDVKGDSSELIEDSSEKDGLSFPEVPTLGDSNGDAPQI